MKKAMISQPMAGKTEDEIKPPGKGQLRLLREEGIRW
jgi:hypothetical protein